jgi:hypothetical protein
MILAAGLLIGTQGGYLHNPYSDGGREKGARRAVMKGFEGLGPVFLQYSHCIYDDIDTLHPSLPHDRIEIARVISWNTAELPPSPGGRTFSYRAPDLVPSLSQRLSNVAADETARACNQHRCHFWIFLNFTLCPTIRTGIAARVS